ncbi:MAG: ATP-binding protein [Actinomycetota bacterium]|nr:HAMP domain-containing protein [Actinomycetota bacterium]
MRRTNSLSLRWKLMAPFVLLTIVWASTGTFLLARSASSRAEARVESDLQREAQAAATSFADLVATDIELVRLAAHTDGVLPALINSDPTALEGLLKPLLINSRAQLIAVVDSTGQEKIGVWRDKTEAGARLPVALRSSMGQVQDTASDKSVSITTSDRGKLLIASGSIRDGDARVGSLVVGTFASTLADRLSSAVRGPVALYDSSAELVATAGKVEPVARSVITNQRPERIRIGDTAVSTITLSGRGGTVVARLALFKPTEGVATELGKTAGGIALLGIAAIAAVFGIGLLVARAITAPLGRVAATAGAIANGDLSQRAKVRQGDEIGRLGAAFNEMADRLQTSYEELEKRVEERTNELTVANEALARVGQAKSEFLANMSHELRTPLNAVIGYSELMADPYFGPLKGAEVRRQAKAINQSGKHLLELINDVLDLSKIEAGRLTLNIEQVHIRKTIKQVVGLVQTLADAKQIRLRTKIAASPVAVYADEKRFRQILLNLLSNAIKFTPDGGTVTIRSGECDEFDKDGEGYLWIQVIDTGIGIADEFRSKVFEQFLQVDGSYARQQEGTGLGLALTKRLVEMHGGHIDVESEVGKGSEFRFTLRNVQVRKRVWKAS